MWNMYERAHAIIKIKLQQVRRWAFAILSYILLKWECPLGYSVQKMTNQTMHEY